MTTPTSNRRWYHVTPDRFFLGLLVVQVFLLLSDQFQWFAFNEHKGWTVLIAVGVVCAAILVMLVWGLLCLCLRRRFQFSIRSLLVFMVAVTVPLGWFAWEMEKARRQREVVAAIARLGGDVSYDYEFDENGMWTDSAEPTTPPWLRGLAGDDFFCEVVLAHCGATEIGDHDAKHLKRLTKLPALVLGDTQITDNGLAHFKGLTRLEALFLDGTQVTDHGLVHLNGMTKLELLSLDRTQITDDGLTHLKKLPNLNYLALGDTHITDDGVAHLKGMMTLENLFLHGTQFTDNGLAQLVEMTRLELVSLSRTQITDDGLVHLKGLTELKNLSLVHTQVTDSGLAHLVGLAKLEVLYLGGTQVTDKGVERLKAALPNCQIYRSSPP